MDYDPAFKADHGGTGQPVGLRVGVRLATVVGQVAVGIPSVRRTVHACQAVRGVIGTVHADVVCV